VVESSEQAMLAETSHRIKEGKPVVFFGWQPHPMNVNLPMVYGPIAQATRTTDRGPACPSPVTTEHGQLSTSDIGERPTPHFDVGSDQIIFWEVGKPENAAQSLKDIIKALSAVDHLSSPSISTNTLVAWT
jgi:Substrate binding domain of ABC-type glycine betaine transport system